MAQINNTQLPGFHNWLHHISQELKGMRELESSDIIKGFAYKETPIKLQPPKVLNTTFTELLNQNK